MWNVMKQVLWVAEFGNTFVENRNLSQKRAKNKKILSGLVCFGEMHFWKREKTLNGFGTMQWILKN